MSGMSVRRRSIPRRFLLVSLVILAGAVIIGKGCMSPRSIANRNPIGERFPTVTGKSLEEAIMTPDSIKRRIGY